MYGRFYEMNKRDSQRANRKAKEERLNRTTAMFDKSKQGVSCGTEREHPS